jgi:uncharacterized protein (TIGR02266 family)
VAYPLRIVADPPPPMDTLPTSEEQELARAEHEVNQRELQLAGEQARLNAAAGSVLGRVQHLQAVVAQAQLGDDAAARAFRRRVQEARVPGLAADGIRQRALQARRSAIEARMQAAEDLRQAVQAHAAGLSRLATQLAADEAELAQHQKAAQERAQQRAAAAVVAPPPAMLPRKPAPAPAAAMPAAPAPAAPAAPKVGRRETPRVQMQAAIDFGSESNFFTGFSTNISEGGLFIATVQYVPRGTQVDLRFTLPNGTQISAHGEVRWTREINDKTPEIFPGVGVQFTNLAPEAAHAIKQFVASREPMFYPD